jgi:DNA-directed RNA polymerase specialized sigma24 family protein
MRKTESRSRMGAVTELAVRILECPDSPEREQAKAEMLVMVQEHVRRIAAARYAREACPRPSVAVSDLVQEVSLRLWEGAIADARTTRDLYRIIGNMVFQILVDHARRRKVRGRFEDHLTDRLLNELSDALKVHGLDPVEVHEELKVLEGRAPDLYEAVMVTFFSDAEPIQTEAAKMIGISVPTLRKRLEAAKIWLLARCLAG